MGYQMLCLFRRARYEGAKDIGTWYVVLNGVSNIAVLTNVCLIGITSPILSQMLQNQGGKYSVLWIMVLLEHLLLGFKFLLAAVIPDTPRWVERAIARQQLMKDKELYKSAGNPLGVGWEDDSEKMEEIKNSVDLHAQYIGQLPGSNM